MKAYYFSCTDKKLGYDDNRVIKKGRTHKVKGPLKLCLWGLHASKRIIDALEYAPGPYLWVVELSGDIIEGSDKVCASERTYIQGFNAEKLLKVFARKQTLINIEKIKPHCSETDYKLILQFLETGNENIRSAAQSAARSARYAAWSAGYAARSAARSAAWSAGYAARSAARSAAESAARYVAWSAESAARSTARFAAQSAARSATRCAVEYAANDMLQKMVDEQLGKL